MAAMRESVALATKCAKCVILLVTDSCCTHASGTGNSVGSLILYVILLVTADRVGHCTARNAAAEADALAEDG